MFATQIQQHVPTTQSKYFYFFLDDYSKPLVRPTTQRILNSIVFRRSAKLVFKVATESTESIELVGLNEKVLEQEDDFVLLDSGTVSIQRKRRDNEETLLNILQPRIERDSLLHNRHITVESVLGKTPYDNTELARQLRVEGAKQRSHYHAVRVFCDLWTSNTREMISLFSDLVAVGRSRIEHEDWTGADALVKPLVRPEDQDRLLRNAGARYRDLLVSATDPTKSLHEIPQGDRSYGEHLQKIADGFQEIADYELQHKNSKNSPQNPPKQARKIEITDVSRSLPDELWPFYVGMIRYGLFIRDSRGKSVRGKAVPRLFLRGILIPYYTLTFSKRDSVTMEWKQFCDFLRDPKGFAQKWPRQQPHAGQEDLPGVNT